MGSRDWGTMISEELDSVKRQEGDPRDQAKRDACRRSSVPSGKGGGGRWEPSSSRAVQNRRGNKTSHIARKKNHTPNNDLREYSRRGPVESALSNALNPQHDKKEPQTKKEWEHRIPYKKERSFSVGRCSVKGSTAPKPKRKVQNPQERKKKHRFHW